MRAPVAAIFLICFFVSACPERAAALDCATAGWWNFDRSDGDPQKQRQDAEARAALANLGPIVFRGRFAWARYLSDIRKTNSPRVLIALRNVEVLQGEMPRSVRDRKAFVVYHGWCDSKCRSIAQWRLPRGPTTFSARPFDGGPVRDTNDDGTSGGKIVYNGRVDAQSGACESMWLTPLQEQVVNAPADEIARLMREYPFHPIRKDEPTNPD